MDDRDYSVGFKKPPREHQFKPGVSGNPKGSIKGKRGLKTDLAAALEAQNVIHINKKQIKGTNQRLAVLTLVTRASAGDLKAQNILFPMIIQILGADDRNTGQRQLSALDQAIFDELLAGERESEPGKAADADADKEEPDA